MTRLIPRPLMFGNLIVVSPSAPTPIPSPQGGGEKPTRHLRPRPPRKRLPSPLWGGAGGGGLAMRGAA